MTKLRGYIPTMLLLVTLMFGATAANAGIIVTDRTGSYSTDGDPCKEEGSSLTKIAASIATFVKTGIIVTDRNGIIVTDRNGIIVTDRSSQQACGIIVTD